MRLACAALSLALTVGCIGVKPQRGGTISHKSATGAISQATQPENPKDSTSQHTESRSEKETVIQPGGVLEVYVGTNLTTFRVPKDSPAVTIRDRTEDKSDVNVGGSFADTARELGAKLSAMRPVQWVGIACILGSLALFYFGWITKGCIAAGVGIGMIVVAAVIPGNELLILGVGMAVLVVGSLLVLYAYHKGMLDKDKDGVLDVFQKGDKSGDEKATK